MRCAMQVVPELVERDFGEFELQQDSYYQKVWDADMVSPSIAPAGGESVKQVSGLRASASRVLGCAHIVGLSFGSAYDICHV